jgi:hypothetical protein
MNTDKLERKLLAAARVNAPSDSVPYAFEKRITARLGPVPAFDVWADWSRALWKAAAPCVAVAIVLGVWASFRPESSAGGTDLSQELENTLLVSVTQDGNNAW